VSGDYYAALGVRPMLGRTLSPNDEHSRQPVAVLSHGFWTRAFQDIQKALQEQSQRVYGDNSRMSQDLWAQFMNLQGPAMQSLMQAYIEQSQKMFAQFQEQMQSQARNMFTGLSFPGFPSGQQKSDNDKT